MIDEKVLIKAIEKWQESLSPRTDIRDSIIFDTLESVIATIDDMDKVNIDEVVEQLKEAKKPYESQAQRTKGVKCNYNLAVVCGLEKAIEIVKGWYK